MTQLFSEVLNSKRIPQLFNRLLSRLIGEEGSQASEFSSLTKGSADAYKAYVDATAAFEDAKKEVYLSPYRKEDIRLRGKSHRARPVY